MLKSSLTFAIMCPMNILELEPQESWFWNSLVQSVGFRSFTNRRKCFDFHLLMFYDISRICLMSVLQLELQRIQDSTTPPNQTTQVLTYSF